MNYNDPDNVPPVWRVGDVILDRYEVKQVFTGGGMGLVYRVHHRDWAMDLAVKSPRPEFFQTQQHIENFEREAETWVNLGLHPHTVSCYYVRRLGGIPRIFTEFVDGGSLADWITSRRLYEGGPDRAMERILDIAIQFAWGLHYAHEQGLIHQDVKPGNVLVNTDGTVKVTDFGLAKARALAGKTPMYSAGQSILVTSGGMTPAYCSPEQANGKPLSRKTDIWSWAVSVLEMMTGEVTWTTGLAAPSALEDFYEGQSATDPISILLADCLNYSADKRSGDFLAIAKTLQRIYLQTTGQAYRRKTPTAADIDADSMNNRAISFLDLGMQDKAEECFDKALKRHPAHPHATYNRGLMLWRIARLTDANLIMQLEEICKNTSDWLCSYLLGLVHTERMDGEAAIMALETALTLGGGQEVIGALDKIREPAGKWPRCMCVFEGHERRVNSIALNANGTLVLSGGWDKTLRIWEVSTGRCVRRFEIDQHLRSLSLAADGSHALCGGSDGSLRSWEVSTGFCLGTFLGHEEPVDSAALSPCSRWAFSGSSDTTIRKWDLATRECVQIFRGHSGAVTSMALGRDGQSFWSGSTDGTLRLWDAATAECLRVIEGHAKAITSIALSNDQRWLLSGSDDMTVRLWKAATGRLVKKLEGHGSAVTSAVFNPDGSLILSASKDRTVRLWESATGVCARTFDGHEFIVFSVAFDPKGNWALSGSADKTLRLWSVSGLEQVHAELVAPMLFCRITNSEDALQNEQRFRQLMIRARAADQCRQVYQTLDVIRAARALPGYHTAREALDLWNLAGSFCRRTALNGIWCMRTFRGHTATVNAVQLSKDALLAISGTSDGMVRVWEISTGLCLQELFGHTASVSSVALSHDGRWVVSGSDDNTLRLWERVTGQCVRILEGHSSGVTSVAFDGAEQLVLSGSADKTLRSWNLATGKCVQVIEGHTRRVSCVAFGGGATALSGSWDNTLRLWDLATGICLRHFVGHESHVSVVAFSIEGRWAISGSADKTLRLWDVSTGKCLQCFRGHTDQVTSAALTADGRSVVSGSSDKTIRLWDIESGRCVHTSDGHGYCVRSVALSANGRWALSGSLDTTLRLWELDWEYEFPGWVDWDEGARPHLETFLALHISSAPLAQHREPREGEIARALTGEGVAAWTKGDFQQLLQTLGYAGYGWVRPEGVKRELEIMVSKAY